MAYDTRLKLHMVSFGVSILTQDVSVQSSENWITKNTQNAGMINYIF